MSVPSNREARKTILKTLDFSYPYGASEELISITLAQVGFNISPGELQKHLTYLEQKEYLTREVVTSRDSDIIRKISKLTAKGKDLLEGNIPKDPGIGL